MNKHDNLMKTALRLAARGRGFVSPNPMVGAVIVKDGTVIAKGYHHYYGGDHAEVDAIKKAKGNTGGAEMYVTLEPCSHSGKTPPCVEAIVRAGIGKVYVGAVDPNLKVCGNGIRFLQDAGIEVTSGILAEESKKLNKVFFKFMETGYPFVTLKLASSLDGRITKREGVGTAVTGMEARKEVHRIRARHDAILIGLNTAKIDNPSLTVRYVKGRSPRRVILDPMLECPTSLKVLRGHPETIVFCSASVTGDHIKSFQKTGPCVIPTGKADQHSIDPEAVVLTLAGMGISSLMVEGGSQVATSFLKEKLVDYCYLFFAPVFYGTGLQSVSHPGKSALSEEFRFDKVRRFGNDLCIGMEKITPGEKA